MSQPNILIATYPHTGSTVIARLYMLAGLRFEEEDPHYRRRMEPKVLCEVSRSWDDGEGSDLAGLRSWFDGLPRPWVAKDVRLWRTLPTIRERLPQGTIVVGLFRDPEKVVASYARRSDPMPEAEVEWMRRCLDVNTFANGDPSTSYEVVVEAFDSGSPEAVREALPGCPPISHSAWEKMVEVFDVSRQNPDHRDSGKSGTGEGPF